jgi:hypothetical protein
MPITGQVCSKHLVEKPQEKMPLLKHICRRRIILKMGLREMGWSGDD